VSNVKRVVRSSALPLGFNMTPMIDIIFQLIIFFLAVNQFQKAETDSSVLLPVASPDHVEPDVDTGAARVILNALPGQGVTAAGKTIDESDLLPFLRQQRLQAGRGDLEVWIRADRLVPYSQVEPILLACTQAGIWKVSFKVIANEEGP
jgi:biopolymer transport protein ExbD